MELIVISLELTFISLEFCFWEKEEEHLFEENIPRGSRTLGTNRTWQVQTLLYLPKQFAHVEAAKLTKTRQNSLLTSK